ncbi:unnamed protein product [Linum trigynum]|uniref:Uncharacterized protein n=1 Tax=Linum trigynum TaxID=586398 RepID=A0AAV2E870_9ROSI
MRVKIAAIAGSAGKSASGGVGESGADVLLIIGDGDRRWKARVEVDRRRNREGKRGRGKKLREDGGNPDVGRENWDRGGCGIGGEERQRRRRGIGRRCTLDCR